MAEAEDGRAGQHDHRKSPGIALAQVSAAGELQRGWNAIEDVAAGDVLGQPGGDLHAGQRGDEGGQADAGGGERVHQAEDDRGGQAAQHRHHLRQPRDAEQDRADHARHHRHGRDAEIDLAAEEDERDTGRDDGQRRHLRQDVPQIHQVEEAVRGGGEEHEHGREGEEGGQAAGAAARPVHQRRRAASGRRGGAGGGGNRVGGGGGVGHSAPFLRRSSAALPW